MPHYAEELKAVFGLLQSLWTRDQPAVHCASSGEAWSARLAPVVRHLADTLRADTVALLTKAGGERGAWTYRISALVVVSPAIQFRRHFDVCFV